MKAPKHGFVRDFVVTTISFASAGYLIMRATAMIMCLFSPSMRTTKKGDQTVIAGIFLMATIVGIITIGLSYVTLNAIGTQIERGKFIEATAMSIGLILGLTIAYVSFKSDGSNSKESTLSARNLKRIENYEKTVKVGNTNLHVVHQRMGAAMLKSQLPGESTQHLMKRWAGTLTPADREEEQYYPYCH